ncbi:MAG: DUF1015 domain-containing protein [Deltaproteobacteria bacterium]|nr:DUF1015 domain-containing protein [Deltaproteobacteria bacterium]
MAILKPFKALRPKPQLAEKVAAPPYDVLSSEEARQMAADNPVCFLRVNKAEITLPEDVDPHSAQVYETARDNLRSLIEQGVMIREEQPRLYLYEQRMGEHVQAGFVAGASVDEYDGGSIRKHEHTKPDKVEDRARLIDVMDSQVGPVFLAFRSQPRITAIVEDIKKGEPVYGFTADDGVGHRVWILDDELEARTVQAFAGVDALYVADGHHRSASSSRVRQLRKEANPQHRGDEPYNFFLTVIFPHDQLKILDYNRLVRDLNGLSGEEFLGKIAERFEVSPALEPRPPKSHTFGMLLGGQWYRLAAREGSFAAGDPVRSLDVAILQENLLSPVLGIENPRTDPRIDFVGGIRGLGELEKRCSEGWAVAFAMFPTTLDELFAVADSGEVMPPKSTWFEPKLRSGLLVRMMDG